MLHEVALCLKGGKVKGCMRQPSVEATEVVEVQAVEEAVSICNESNELEFQEEAPLRMQR